MHNCGEKIENFFNKITPVIKRFVIPCVIIVILLFLIAQCFGFDLPPSKIIAILGLSGSIYELAQLLVMYVGLWIACHLIIRIEPRDEYRDYLIKELENDREEFDTGEAKKGEKSAKGSSNRKDSNSTSGVSIEQRKSDKKDIIALMLKNNKEIAEYFKISKSQAKCSFWLSVIFCIVGMIALAFGIYGIVILKDISVSAIGLISGSISELSSGTVFWIHNKSALQLNRYYDALHENEKFLSAVNIAEKLSAEKKEEILVDIIHKQINSAYPNYKSENNTQNDKNEEG